jgi:hypothetical protein
MIDPTRGTADVASPDHPSAPFNTMLKFDTELGAMTSGIVGESAFVTMKDCLAPREAAPRAFRTVRRRMSLRRPMLASSCLIYPRLRSRDGP